MWVSGIAAEALLDEIPAFVHTPEAMADIAVLGRELDRSKGSGVTHERQQSLLNDELTVYDDFIDAMSGCRRFFPPS